jgi:hypothetical protein
MKTAKKGIVNKEYGDALVRAREGNSHFNDARIMAGFSKLGIAVKPEDIRENILTFDGWLALGKVVKKGQHGVSIIVFRRDKKTGRTQPGWARVFHVSQVETLTGPIRKHKAEKAETAPAPAPAPEVNADDLHNMLALLQKLGYKVSK